MNTALCSRTMSNCVPHRHDQVLLLIHKRSYEDDNLCRDIDREFNGKTVVINLIVDEKRCMSRRAFSSGLTLTSVFGMNGQEWTSAEAMSLFSPAKERRQLELCLVIILRLLSWAQHVESKMLIVPALHVSQNEAASVPVPVTVTFSISDKSNWNTSAYVEARLGAKALLTGRIGGGSPPRVYDLAQFQIRECFDDLLFASKNLGLQRQAQNEVDTIIDALASIVGKTFIISFSCNNYLTDLIFILHKNSMDSKLLKIHHPGLR